jgi:hypothetical protein
MRTFTFMGASAAHRLLVAAACIAFLWLAVYWALA